MIDLDKQYPDRLYFSINEVSDFLDVPASTLRYWGKEFSVLQLRKNGKGDRLYTKEDIQLVRTIHHLLKEKKYTIDGAERYLNKKKDNASVKFDAIEKLEKIKFFLKELRKQL